MFAHRGIANRHSVGGSCWIVRCQQAICLLTRRSDMRKALVSSVPFRTYSHTRWIVRLFAARLPSEHFRKLRNETSNAYPGHKSMLARRSSAPSSHPHLLDASVAQTDGVTVRIESLRASISAADQQEHGSQQQAAHNLDACGRRASVSGFAEEPVVVWPTQNSSPHAYAAGRQAHQRILFRRHDRMASLSFVNILSLWLLETALAAYAYVRES